jgi:hypothetical protein
MPRPRVRSQLVVEASPDLLDRVRAAASARRLSIKALVLDWIEAGLSGGVSAAAPLAGTDGLADRVAQLEAAVAELQKAAPGRGVLASRSAPGLPLDQSPLAGLPVTPEPIPTPLPLVDLQPLPERRLTAAEAQGLVTVPELAATLGLATGSAITNWIAREAGRRGGSAVGAVYRGHRLRGKGLLPGGQKPGWLFEPVTP